MFLCEEISRPAALQNISWWLSMMKFFIYLMHNTAHSANIQVFWGQLTIPSLKKPNVVTEG